MEIFTPSEVKPIGASLSISDIKGIGYLKRLHLDFSCNISFMQFNEGYEQYKKYLNSDVTITFNDNRDAYIILLKGNQNEKLIEPVIINDNKVTFSAVNYIRYLIINTVGFNENYSDTKRTEIGLLLMGDVTDEFTAKGEKGKVLIEELHNSSKKNTFLFDNYIDYIKYNNRGKIKGDVIYRDTVVDIMKTMMEDIPDFKEIIDDIKYERKLEKTNILDYIVYCSIFLGKDLYIVHYITGKRDESNVWVTDKRRLGNHLKKGAYVLNISEIIVNFYNSALCEAFEGADFLEIAKKKQKTEQEWEKLFYDMLEDSKSKNKITFNIESKGEYPIFMASKWIEQDLNKYKLIEDELGENGEITKKKSKGKWNALGVVKRRVYGNKGIENNGKNKKK